ncbi:hypothetical protein ACA910_010365 [Epithemia clementina (nom. ined.)]
MTTANAIQNSSSCCTQLALTLSANFRQTDPFRGDNNTPNALSRYLSTHGILLTMCFPFQCVLPLGSTQMAGSWINALTGVEIIPTFDSNVGLILDPTKINIRCVYPTDAASDWRYDDGCGPFRWVQDDSSDYLWRQRLHDYKTMNFGVDTPWEHVDCATFFPVDERLYPRLALTWKFQPTRSKQKKNKNNNNTLGQSSDDDKNETYKNGQLEEEKEEKSDPNYRSSNTFMKSELLPDLEFQSLDAFYQQEYAALLGHRVCHVTDVNNKNKVFLIYSGPTSWNGTEWQTAMNLQHNFMQHYKRRRLPGNNQDGNITLFWNEIVMALPRPQLQDAVLAVFYLVDDDRRDSHDTLLLHRRNERQSTRRIRAHHEARVLGGVPVLRLRPNVVGTPSMDGGPYGSSTPEDDTTMDLLTCDDDDEEEEDSRTPR